MDGGILAYIQRLELLAFFSGYPLIYCMVLFLSGKNSRKKSGTGGLVSLLPVSYALLGILYLGLLLKNVYPVYAIASITRSVQEPGLKIWAVCSVFFCIPFFRQRPLLSLLHSLIFFFFILRDVFFQLSGMTTDSDMVSNDMKIYSTSLLLNLVSFGFITAISFLINRIRKI